MNAHIKLKYILNPLNKPTVLNCKAIPKVIIPTSLKKMILKHKVLGCKENWDTIYFKFINIPNDGCYFYIFNNDTGFIPLNKVSILLNKKKKEEKIYCINKKTKEINYYFINKNLRKNAHGFTNVSSYKYNENYYCVHYSKHINVQTKKEEEKEKRVIVLFDNKKSALDFYFKCPIKKLEKLNSYQKDKRQIIKQSSVKIN